MNEIFIYFEGYQLSGYQSKVGVSLYARADRGKCRYWLHISDELWKTISAAREKERDNQVTELVKELETVQEQLENAKEETADVNQDEPNEPINEI